jgi:NitT/TauT family transport system permease protein
MRIKMKSNLITKLIWIFLILAIWQISAGLQIVSHLLLPSVVTIFKALYISVKNGEILVQASFSFFIIVKGMVIGIVLAFVLSTLSLFSKIFRSFLLALISIMHPLPGVALLPLIILWFGVGSNAVVFVIVHSVLWPLVINIQTGFDCIPESYIYISDNLELNLISKIFSIYIPASFPYILSGLKIGWARGWRALISAEMIFGAASNIGGIGYFIFEKRVYMDTAGMFAGLFIVVLIGILVEEFIFYQIEKRTVVKWGNA